MRRYFGNRAKPASLENYEFFFAGKRKNKLFFFGSWPRTDDAARGRAVPPGMAILHLRPVLGRVLAVRLV